MLPNILLSLLFTTAFSDPPAEGNVVSLEDFKNRPNQSEQTSSISEAKISEIFERMEKANREGRLSPELQERFLLEFLGKKSLLTSQSEVAQIYYKRWVRFLLNSFYLESFSPKAIELLVESISEIRNSTNIETHKYADSLLRDLIARLAVNSNRESIRTTTLVEALSKYKLRLNHTNISLILSSIDINDFRRFSEIYEGLQRLYEKPKENLKADKLAFQKNFSYTVQAYITRFLLIDWVNPDLQGNYIRELFRFTKTHSKVPDLPENSRRALERLSVEELNQIRKDYIKSFSLDLLILKTFLNARLESLSEKEVRSLFTNFIQEDLRVSKGQEIIHLKESSEKADLEERIQRYKNKLVKLLNDVRSNASLSLKIDYKELEGRIKKAEISATGNYCRPLFQ